MRVFGYIVPLVWGLGMVGCGGDATEDGSPAGGDLGAEVEGCERAFEAAVQRATWRVEGEVMDLVVKDSATPPFNQIVLASYQGPSNQGPTGPGEIDLTGSTYSNCSFCVTAGLNCTTESNCETTLFADEGTVSITELSDLSLPFKASINDVVFKEVDMGLFTPSVLDGGKRWCAGDHSFDAKLNRYFPSLANEDGEEGGVAQGVAHAECVPGGSGKGIGHNIADYSLTNCTGASVPLHSRCGSGAVWLIASAGW